MSSNNFPLQNPSFWDFISNLQQANNNNNNTNNSSQRTETPRDAAEAEGDNNTYQNDDNSAMDWANSPWAQWVRQGGLESGGFPFGNNGPFGGPRRRGRGRPHPPFGPQPGHGPPPPGPPPHPRHEHPHRPHSPHHPHGHPHGPPSPGPHHHDLPHRPHHPHRHHSPGAGGPSLRNQHTWDSLNSSLGGPPAWLNELGTFLSQHFDINDTNRQNNAESTNFHNFNPDVDVFDTEKSYVVHISLAGAKKEDVNVDWDAEKSELVVSGVIYRPGDEEFLKTLALDERKVGAFERKVKLGSSSSHSPIVIEVERISAKMEDGVLRVTLPKQEKDDFVEVHHVDVD